jgi:hypothetical protein
MGFDKAAAALGRKRSARKIGEVMVGQSQRMTPTSLMVMRCGRRVLTLIYSSERREETEGGAGIDLPAFLHAVTRSEMRSLKKS